MSEERDKTIIRSLEKANNILKHFSKSEPLLSLNDIAQKSGNNKTTILRYCNTLEKIKFLEKIYIGNTPYYRLGIHLFVIGNQALHAIDLPTRARPYIKKMVEETNENAYLFIERNNRAYCVDTIKGGHVINANTTHVGDSYPLIKGAGPLAILASMERETQNAVLSDLELTQDEIDKLYARLEFIYFNEYSISHNETYKGTVAVGAPVMNHEGDAIGALSLGGIESRFTEDELPKIISVVKSAANKLSKELGQEG
ncbi:IclR family transcriptional regulator [Salicibibacter cibarius]|uniref:IclR family transcriptional regulator n=1 Tax=Salicibibacter cibarius TaxID=2743000 RepID=A0A7T6Z490_9BACI|nr:IclR family transcriptional regulator [Salicibibacter cibarius]QQK76536.1 IclR family transcriptional regulator [Salicibibacter cibarius]